MLEILAPIIGNGSTAWTWGYAPWLPFYDFVPALIVMSVLLTCALHIFMRFNSTRAILWGAVFLTSGLFACAPVFVLWVKLDLNPKQVFFWWAVNWILIMIGQLYYIRTNENVKEQIKEMEDRAI